MPTSLRILVVEDFADTYKALRLLLKRWGHEVVVAADGPAALSAAAAFCPDVVLLDIGLPGMDGYEVAARLRALSCLGHPLVVATTGFGQPEDVERCLRAGCDVHLLKPFDPLVLKQLLDLHACEGGPRGETDIRQEGKPSRPSLS